MTTRKVIGDLSRTIKTRISVPLQFGFQMRRIRWFFLILASLNTHGRSVWIGASIVFRQNQKLPHARFSS